MNHKVLYALLVAALIIFIPLFFLKFSDSSSLTLNDSYSASEASEFGERELFNSEYITPPTLKNAIESQEELEGQLVAIKGQVACDFTGIAQTDFPNFEEGGASVFYASAGKLVLRYGASEVVLGRCGTTGKPYKSANMTEGLWYEVLGEWKRLSADSTGTDRLFFNLRAHREIEPLRI